MRPFILFAVLFVLAGCQTVDDFIGEGPINLSRGVSDHYQNKYLKGVGPQYYVVSEDGRHSRYVYCSAGPGQCTFGLVVLDSISRCEKSSKQKCYILAEGDEVIWKGPVSFNGRPARPAKSAKQFDGKVASGINLTRVSNLDVCNWAIKSEGSSAKWRTDKADLPYVQQARIRGLSLQFCAEYLKAGKVAGLTDATLCNYALGTYGDHPAWVATGRFAKYFHEAQRRGFNPKTCMDTVVKSGQKIHSAEKIDPTNIENRRGFMLTNKKLCAPALDIEQGKAQWSQYKAYLGYIYEAQYRGLTAASCHQATKAGAAANSATKDVGSLSDTELCNLSVILPEGVPDWSQHVDEKEYVKAAKERDLSPSKCITSPYVS